MCHNFSEKLNNVPFGSWNLLESTIDALRNDECQLQRHLTCDSKYPAIIAAIQIKSKQKWSNQETYLDCLNDFHVIDEANILNEIKPNPICSKSDEVPLQASELTTKLIDTAKQDEPGVQEIIDILSKVSVKLLERSIPDAWNELTAVEDKHKLIKLLSAYQSCLGILCQKSLYPVVKDEVDKFSSVMEIIMPVIQWFGIYAISDLLIPLLVDSESYLAKDTDLLKNIITKLSSTQQSDLVRCFIDLMENGLNKNYLHVFMTVIWGKYY